MDTRIKHLLESLGIDPRYGVDPPLPVYVEATELVTVEANIVGRTQRLTPNTAAAWASMKAAAHGDGVTLLIVSGFRSIDDQAAILRRKLAAGHELASILRVNVAPGFSQHHTGRAIDIATPGSRPLTEQFRDTDAYAWLLLNGARFDFRMPYSETNSLGLAFEPWHWSQLDG